MTINITEVNEDNFDLKVINSKLPVLVDFWAPWCSPCKSIVPYLEEIANNFLLKIKVMKLNIDSNPKIVSNFNIKSIPTLLFFINGKLVDQMVGIVSKKNIEKMIHLYI